MSTDDHEQQHPARLDAVTVDSTPRPSTSSDSFSSGRRSPSINEFDSSAALIVVPENDHDDLDAEDHTVFEFFSSSDDDSPDGDLDDDGLGRPTGSRYSAGPVLSSTAVFFHLLSPLLKLGALLSSSPRVNELPLRISLPALFFFANLCALTRQIWYMLARYVKRADMEEIVLQTFARGAGRGREGERKRRWIQLLVRSGTGILRVMLVAVYLRAAVSYVTPLLPDKVLHVVPSRVLVTLALALGVSPLCVLPSASLGATSVLWATWISVATYIAWVAGTAYAHAKGFPLPTQDDTGTEGSFGALWQGLSIIAFTFTTSSTLPLYATLRNPGTVHDSTGAPKPGRSRTFKLLSLTSVTVASLLILPPTIFRLSAAAPLSTSQEQPDTLVASTSFSFQCAMAFLSAVTLVLGIPSVIVTLPTVPIPHSVRRRLSVLSASRLSLYTVAIVLSLLPSAFSRCMSDILMALAFLGTFTVPAFIHIVIHNFRRPLSIVMPPTTPSVTLLRSDSYNDELLQQKERMLQRRRSARRLFWDVGVWVLLLPVGGGGVAWAAGRLVGRW